MKLRMWNKNISRFILARSCFLYKFFEYADIEADRKEQPLNKQYARMKQFGELLDAAKVKIFITGGRYT